MSESDDENRVPDEHPQSGPQATNNKPSDQTGPLRGRQQEPSSILSCCFPPWRRGSYKFHAAANQIVSPSGLSLSRLALTTPHGAFNEWRRGQGDVQEGLSFPDELQLEDGVQRGSGPLSVVTQIDYVHFFVPRLSDIINCPYYWGKMDRYEAESVLENRPEGSFLLRDSAQDEFVFSVSFRRYNRSLHARIEESKHRFSFDCHDPGVHSSSTVIGLLEYYKEPMSCMFFEPMLLHPVARSRCFTLQELVRPVVCDHCTYDQISHLPLPQTLKNFLRDYSYKHKIRSRQIEPLK